MFDWNPALLAPFNPEAETMLQNGYSCAVGKYEDGWLAQATSRLMDGRPKLRYVYPTKALAKLAVEEHITENQE